ncbi:MAG TPA: hypothetical protein VGC15_20400 [Acetobacteraceae bacterium]
MANSLSPGGMFSPANAPAPLAALRAPALPFTTNPAKLCAVVIGAIGDGANMMAAEQVLRVLTNGFDIPAWVVGDAKRMLATCLGNRGV